MDINNKDLLQQIITQSPNYIFWKDTDLIYRGCNYNFAKAAGFDNPQQVIGKKDDDLKWGEFTGRIYQAEDRQIIATGKPILNKEVPMMTEAGHEQFLSVSKVPLYDNQCRIIGVLGIYIDITKQKEMEKNLIAEKEKAERALKAEEELRKAKYQLEGAKLISGSIAHEMRTPLAAIKSAIFGMNNSLSELISINESVRNKNLNVNPISDDEVNDLKEAVEIINGRVDQSNVVINMLLTKLQSLDFEFTEFSTCLISNCIHDALKEFIVPDNLQSKIHFNENNDFEFLGNRTLVAHIIMNLLKNAVFYILKAGKGDITIWLENHTGTNEVHFKDTGTGISPKILPRIFDSFFTTESSTGTGVGLAFSKMVMQSHRGTIQCVSQEGEYTEFIMSFLRLDNQES